MLRVSNDRIRNLWIWLGYLAKNPQAKSFNLTNVALNPMIKLRLKRFGKKREVSYRIVAIDSASRRDGRPLEEVGFYNPRTDETRLDVPAITRRLEQGAQPTKTVRHILEKADLLEKQKFDPRVKAETKAEA